MASTAAAAARSDAVAFWRSPETQLARLCAVLIAVVWLGSLVVRPHPAVVAPLRVVPGGGAAPSSGAGLAGPASAVKVASGRPHQAKVDLWPVPPEWSSERLQWKDDNLATLRHLQQCLDGLPPCSAARRQIVLLQAKAFRSAEAKGPEAELAADLLSGLTTLELTVLYVPNLEVASHFYALFPGMVKAAIVDKPELNRCWQDNNCVKSPSNPLGTPIQHLHELSANGAPAHPFGPAWQLSPPSSSSSSSAAGQPSSPTTTDELRAWVARDWTALARARLEENPGLGGGLDFEL